MKSVIFIAVMVPALVSGQTYHPQLFDRIAALRLSIERIEQAQQEIGLQRDRLAKQHERLAAQILERKAKITKPGLLPDFGLQQRLRQSQGLSKTLTQLNRELLGLEKAKRDQMQKLLLVYDQLIDQSSDAVRTDSEVGHAELLQLIAQVRVDRERLRLQLMPNNPERKLFENEREWLASEDPEELSERADAVRDEQDRLTRTLAFLDKQIEDLKANRLLEREMNDFLGDHELFDERSRVFSAQTRPTTGNLNDEAALDPDKIDSDPPQVGVGADVGHGVSASVPLGLDPSNETSQTLNLSLQESKKRRKKIVEQLKHLEQIKIRLLTKIKSLGN